VRVQRRETDLKEEVAAALKKNADLVEPELRRLDAEIADLRAESTRADSSAVELRRRKAELTQRVAELKVERQKQQEELAAVRIDYNKVKADPERLRCGVVVVVVVVVVVIVIVIIIITMITTVAIRPVLRSFCLACRELAELTCCCGFVGDIDDCTVVCAVCSCDRSKQILNVTTACTDMQHTLESVESKLDQCEDTIRQQQKKIADLEAQRTAVDEKLDQHVRPCVLCVHAAWRAH
jgi:peptidoglycan hydrolase CwlO-like protein